MRRLVPLLGCALLVLICVARATNATTSFVYLADLQLDPQYDAASPVRAVVLRSRRSPTSEAAGDRLRRRHHPILTTPYHTACTVLPHELVQHVQRQHQRAVRFEQRQLAWPVWLRLASGLANFVVRTTVGTRERVCGCIGYRRSRISLVGVPGLRQ